MERRPILVIELRLESREGIFLTLFFPFLGPKSWADTESLLFHALASFLVTGILQAEKPLVVPIPTVISLVLGMEPSIAGGCANVLYNVDGTLLIVRELRSTSENSLIEFSHDIPLYRKARSVRRGKQKIQFNNVIHTRSDLAWSLQRLAIPALVKASSY